MSDERTCPFNLIPPEIREQIFSLILNFYFDQFPTRREICYQGYPEELCLQEVCPGPPTSDLPALEVALLGDRRLYREIFRARVSNSVLVIRPGETSSHEVVRGQSRERRNRRDVAYPILGLNISPLALRCAKHMRFLTHVYDQLLDEVCVDKNRVIKELGRSLIDLAEWTNRHTTSLNSLTIEFRSPFYAIYDNLRRYEYERKQLWQGLEMLVKKRGVHNLSLKRDDGRGWRSNRPEFGILGVELDRKLGKAGSISFLDEASVVRYNRNAYPHTGTSQTWEAPKGNRLTWGEHDEG